jgi:hypothetical protein
MPPLPRAKLAVGLARAKASTSAVEALKSFKVVMINSIGAISP